MKRSIKCVPSRIQTQVVTCNKLNIIFYDQSVCCQLLVEAKTGQPSTNIKSLYMPMYKMLVMLSICLKRSFSKLYVLVSEVFNLISFCFSLSWFAM